MCFTCLGVEPTEWCMIHICWWFSNHKANHRYSVNNGILTISTGDYPIIYRVLTIPCGAGFLNHQQYEDLTLNGQLGTSLKNCPGSPQDVVRTVSRKTSCLAKTSSRAISAMASRYVVKGMGLFPFPMAQMAYKRGKRVLFLSILKRESLRSHCSGRRFSKEKFKIKPCGFCEDSRFNSYHNALLFFWDLQVCFLQFNFHVICTAREFPSRSTVQHPTNPTPSSSQKRLGSERVTMILHHEDQYCISKYIQIYWLVLVLFQELDLLRLFSLVLDPLMKKQHCKLREMRHLLRGCCLFRVKLPW